MGDEGRATAREASDGEGHWKDRRGIALALRIAAVSLPFVASILAGIVFGALLPRPHTALARIEWWVAVLAVSTVALRVADNLARRLLPIAVLLELSLLFPQRAPSRFRLALESGSSKHLREHLQRAHKIGLEGDPNETAENILTLVAALTMHHRPSRKHSERVRAYTDLLAEELGLADRDRHRLRWAALLHDVGKVTVPYEILEGSGPLDPGSWEVIQRHPKEGARLIHPLWDWLGPWAPTVEQHHERYDGKGYPHGLKGEDICLGARIVTVADSFEAMTARRSYQEPLSLEMARERLAELSGQQFDPVMVRAFLAVSLRKLRWAYGPIAWFLEAPVLAGLSRLAPEVLGAAGQAGAAAAAVGLTVAAAGGASAFHFPVLGSAPASASQAVATNTTLSGRSTTGTPGTRLAGSPLGGGAGGVGTGASGTTLGSAGGGGSGGSSTTVAGGGSGGSDGGGGTTSGLTTTTTSNSPTLTLPPIVTPSTLPLIGPIPLLPPGPILPPGPTVPPTTTPATLPITTTSVTLPPVTTTTIKVPGLTTTTPPVTLPPPTVPTLPGGPKLP